MEFGSLQHALVVKWLVQAALFANGAKVRWAIAAAADVVDGCRRTSTHLASTAFALNRLITGLHWRDLPPQGTTAADYVPQHLTEGDLLLRFKDPAQYKPGSELPDEAGRLTAVFSAIGRSHRVNRDPAVRTCSRIFGDNDTGRAIRRRQNQRKHRSRLPFDIACREGKRFHQLQYEILTRTRHAADSNPSDRDSVGKCYSEP